MVNDDKIKVLPDSTFLIVYHKEDNDGLFSMALFFNYLVHELGVESDRISLFGANYDEMSKADSESWKDDYTDIIMTDISLPVAKMKKLHKEYGPRFIWVDHHAPIIKECDGAGLSGMPGQRLLDRSAIMNAYEYLYNPFREEYGKDVRNPELLRVLSAFDSFTFDKWGYDKNYVTDVNTAVTNRFMLIPKKVVSYMKRYIYGFPTDKEFEEYDENELKIFYEEGRKFNQIKTAEQARLVDEFGSDFTVDDGKRKACALFIQGAVGSQWFESVMEKYANGIIFKRMKNGRWIVSLYNTDYTDKSFHCGEYLKKKYGGGGHIGAAGCQVDEDVFIEMLKNKAI